MHDPDISCLKRAASERQLAVAGLQKKYEASDSIPTEQLVLDMRELLATERVVLDAIITLFISWAMVRSPRELQRPNIRAIQPRNEKGYSLKREQPKYLY